MTQKVKKTEKKFPLIVTTKDIYNELFKLKSKFDVYSFSEVFEILINNYKEVKNE